MLLCKYHKLEEDIIMDVGSVGYGSALTPEVRGQYLSSLMSMSQQTSYIAGSLIQDTVEISAEALAKYTEEMNASIERML